jgi:hypothetical protein
MPGLRFYDSDGALVSPQALRHRLLRGLRYINVLLRRFGFSFRKQRPQNLQRPDPQPFGIPGRTSAETASTLSLATG